MPHSRWFFSSKDNNSEGVKRRSSRQRFISHILTRLFPQMTDNNTNNNNTQQDKENEETEKEIRNSNLTTATTITADSNITNVTNEKNALIQVLEEESNTEATGLGNLSTDFYNQPRRFSDLSSENGRPTQHIVNLSNIESHDTVDVSTIPPDNGSRRRNVYYGTNSNSPTLKQPQSFLEKVKPTKETLAVKILPLSIFLIGASIATIAFLFMLKQEVNRYKESLNYICMERIGTIAATFKSGFNTGDNFVGLFTVFANTLPNIDNVDVLVNIFGNGSAINNMSIRTINFAPKILDAGRSSYEAKHGVIRQYNRLNQLVRRDDAKEYFPVRYSVPWKDDSPVILNFDVASETERAAAIAKARQTRNTTITTRIPLAYDLTKGGIIVLFPFYKNKTNVDVDGFVVGVYEIDKIFQSVAQTEDQSGIGIDVVDLENDNPIYSKDDKIEWHSATFNVQENRYIGDRNWSFTCYSSKDAYNRSVSLLVPSVYLVLIVLFFTFIAFLTSNYFRKLFRARYKFTEQAVKLGRTQSLLKAITADSKAVLEAIADPLVALNAKGEIVGANRHALSLTGYSPEEIKVANKMHIYKLLIPLVETPIEEKNFNPLNGDDQLMRVPVRPGMRDVLARKKDGTLFEAEANFSQPVVEKNYFTQVVMFRDVSFKKENERMVMEAKKDADVANQSKTEFLFFLCHEIRNPAHAILGFAEMLRNSLKEKEQFEELEYIISAGKFLSFIVNDILDLTHLTNPDPYEIELKCDGFNLHTLIDNIAKIQSIEADHKKIQIKTIIGSELPKNVYGDECRLEQILMKLLARSIEVAPSNGIVELIVEQKKIHYSKGVLLRFSVKDQSKGLSSDEEIKELFKPYSKTNSSIGSRFHAQGLSMALVQAIVKVMKGRLVVEKVDRNSDNGKRKDDAIGNNCVWFEIWLLTEEAKERGKFLRESFDSVAVSKNGSAGRNSFKIVSAPGSTDGKLMDDTDFADNDNVTSQTQLRNSKSMLTKSKRDSRMSKSLRKRRRATLTSATVTLNSGEESNDDEVASNSETIRNITNSSKSAATNFFRKGSIMLASGLARASTISNVSNEKSPSPLTASFSQTSVNEDSIHRGGDKNNAISVQIEPQENTPLPIISYYSGGNTSISPGSPVPPVPPLPQDRNLLLSKPTITKTDSVKSKSSSNVSLPISPSVTNVNISQNTSTPPHDTSAFTSTSSRNNIISSSHAAHPTSDTTTIASITNNNNNDNNSKQLFTSDNLADAQVSAVASTSTSSEQQKHLKILLVEDNLVCQRVTNKMLKRNNYSVDIANHGREAVDMLEVAQQQQQQYSCILMDIIMPVMNGYEATQLLRERGVKIPILALTANSFGSDVKKAMDVGMDDFLTKPIKEAELIAAIKTQIEKYENIDSLQNQHDDSMEISVEHKDQYLL